ncbi:hypothetical protein, partial [Desulfocastanea catecholica]
ITPVTVTHTTTPRQTTKIVTPSNRLISKVIFMRFLDLTHLKSDYFLTQCCKVFSFQQPGIKQSRESPPAATTRNSMSHGLISSLAGEYQLIAKILQDLV